MDGTHSATSFVARVSVASLPDADGGSLTCGRSLISPSLSALSLIARAVWGLSGRKSAWLTMVAFLCMVTILLSYAIRS